MKQQNNNNENNENNKETSKMLFQKLKALYPSASMEELIRFIELAYARNLNPITDIHFIKYGNSPAQFIVSKESIIKIAQQKPSYRCFTAGWYNENNEKLMFPNSPKSPIIGAWCEIETVDGGKFWNSVSLNEYNTKRSLWSTKSLTMIRKVAIVQAHREFAPDLVAGLYDSDELGLDLNGQELDSKTKKVQTKELPNNNQDVTPTKQEIKESVQEYKKQNENNIEFTRDELIAIFKKLTFRQGIKNGQDFNDFLLSLKITSLETLDLSILSQLVESLHDGNIVAKFFKRKNEVNNG